MINQGLKTFGDPSTIRYNDCHICLIQNITKIKVTKKHKKNPYFWQKKNKYNYCDPNSFNYSSRIFDLIKHLGFSPMHRRIRVTENICHMAEQKYAKTHYTDIYYGPEKTQENPNPPKPNPQAALKLAHEHFKSEFKKLLNVKYFVPDPATELQKELDRYRNSNMWAQNVQTIYILKNATKGA